MKIFRFDLGVGRKIDKFDSNFIMSRISVVEGRVHIGCMHLEAEGLIGRHEAPIPQLLLIMNGAGQVSGEDGERVNVQSGDAVFWTQGESHETVSQNGLTAIVIEGENLDPAAFMPVKE
ncbi:MULTISPECIES: cupin [unclassified Bacillus (in: firmicutes)]|uniref:cupin n=1 Tax=unclassified Bacillus (in: firmicutes) TaxID=185979 RepID=UPI0008E4991E|nr:MULTISPECIES: cupin [unclassified Bacillus (in: firmicutes)]SFB06276.1 hypothetical protein SAMN02799634_1054 [Bacillus sp. UNCCL13]SFQ87706.1 hypothetical protein SAMN04488577_3114 [Bacillus sp. cl95]